MEAARAAFYKLPPPDVMAASGFTAEDYAAEMTAEVWPENWPSWQLWCQMSSQVRVGFGGAYALDYGPLFVRMDRLGLTDAQWNDLFEDIRSIESIAFAPDTQPPPPAEDDQEAKDE